MSLLQKFIGGTRRKSTKRRGSRKFKGGANLRPLHPAPFPSSSSQSAQKGGKKHRSRRHSKKGGSPLVPFGLLGTLLAVGPNRSSSRRRGSRRRGSRRRGSRKR
jgi:hypothetical protein